MIRWEKPDAERLLPQEKALLALCDRVQLLTIEMDNSRALRRLVERLEQNQAALARRLEQGE